MSSAAPVPASFAARRWPATLFPRPAALFLAVALVVAIPVLVAGTLTHDSFWIDYVWADRFHAALAQGTPYPRWLDGSFDGLGAPVFYFYAPIAFYVVAGAMALGLQTFPALFATFIAFHMLSGVTMHRWLGGHGRPALFGALLYMLLPYHLVDFHRRGALAEFAAFAVLPLVAHGIARIGRGRGPAALAFAYAALAMTHLPTALLASVLLVPPLALHRDNRPRLPVTAAALALGLGMAAIYLLPALTLQRFTNMSSLWAAVTLSPAAWNMADPGRWVSREAGLEFATLIAAVAIPGLAVAALYWRRTRFWPAVALFACLVAGNLVPGFWSIPFLAKVQFPWRALAIAEFALATALAGVVADPHRRRILLWSLLPAVTLVTATILTPLFAGTAGRAALDRDRPEVPEYLPANATIRSSAAAVALARSRPDRVDRDGWSTRRRFWFPDLVVRCDGIVVPSRPDPATGLVRHPAAGACILSRGQPAVVRTGMFLSLLALLLTLATIWMHPSQRRRVPSAVPSTKEFLPWPTPVRSRNI
ncbi:hypothetical protein [Sphingomonas montana]|uniref:hypothetical protein n=1 Tax=Sphingomonas montana TaxID=1843236 RepID=UPI00096C38CF|nr:hypothetical protein [Sphingomonas montana]